MTENVPDEPKNISIQYDYPEKIEDLHFKNGDEYVIVSPFAYLVGRRNGTMT